MFPTPNSNTSRLFVLHHLQNTAQVSNWASPQLLLLCAPRQISCSHFAFMQWLHGFWKPCFPALWSDSCLSTWKSCPDRAESSYTWEATKSREPQRGSSAATGGHEPLQCCCKLSSSRYEQEYFWLPWIRGDAWSRSWSSREQRKPKILLVAKQPCIQDTEHVLKHKHCHANGNPCHILQEGQTKTVSRDSALRVSTEDSLWRPGHGTSPAPERRKPKSHITPLMDAVTAEAHEHLEFTISALLYTTVAISVDAMPSQFLKSHNV